MKDPTNEKIRIIADKTEHGITVGNYRVKILFVIFASAELEPISQGKKDDETSLEAIKIGLNRTTWFVADLKAGQVAFQFNSARIRSRFSI